MKLDPYKHEEKYLKWKEKVKSGISKISKEDSQIILDYLTDMERGVNISQGSIKGPRSFIRLNTLRTRLVFFSKKFYSMYKIKKMTDIKEEELVGFFSDMKNGNIKRENGERYKSVATYTKIFKAFWHWHQKTNRKKGIEVPDITLDLDTKQDKPDWVYLTEEQVKELCDNATYDYRVLIMFLFDTGIRAPTELMNIKVSDFFNECKEVQIREETSKTFGRRIKLMLCSQLLKEFIKKNNLKPEDYVFTITPSITNQYLKRLAKRVLGDGQSEAGQRYSDLSMYDFRHCACCYWLPRYKSESALKYRFGWKKSDKIHYYSELLGMKDTISEEDILIDVTKTEIEKRLEKSEKEKEIMQEKMKVMEEQMNKMIELTTKLDERIRK